MARKLWQYTILKFQSDRLRDEKYNLKISLDEARKNGESVLLAESELIRIINRLKNKEINYDHLEELNIEQKTIKRLPDSKENRKRLVEIIKEKDDSLFIPEILNVEFTDVRHYHQIIKNGLIINGKSYSRLLTGAGMARRSTTMFVENKFGEILKPILDCDRNKEVKLVDAKYNAYSALIASSSHPVTVPRLCVVKDYEFVQERLVDFVVETDGDDYVEERYMPISTNAFDGEGILSPTMALQWSIDLQLDHTPNSFCVRSAYLKGQCVVFDFVRFAEEVAHNYFIEDVWGNQVDIRNVDAILTTSQLKLYSSYASCEDYQNACKKNGIGWGVSRYTLSQEKDTFTSSYQLLQVLDLDKDQLIQIAKPTIDWIKDVSGGNIEKALLYLLGETSNLEQIDKHWWKNITDPVVKALILDNRLMGDSYIRKHISQSLQKKMQEAAMGSLIFNGNWQVCISDPFAFCEHIFGLEVKGLLAENEHYCHYWNERGVTKVASGRSPLTWKSEMNILNLKNNAQLDSWFGHIHSGVIFNIHGVDTMLMADGDFDYDINFNTDNKYFIEGASRGKPVTYEKKTATKNIIDESKLYLADCSTMGSRIGLITNISTSMYSMLPLYEKGTKEYNKLIERLIVCRKLQGNEIDRAKSIIVKDLPKWDKWTKITGEMSEEEKKDAEFNNRIMVWQRPRWMIYLYKKYKNKYNEYLGIYKNHSETMFGENFKDLLEKSLKNEEEQKVYDNYYKYNTFLDSDSNMGIICHYVEDQIKNIKLNTKKNNFDLTDYGSYGTEIDQKKLKALERFCQLYKKHKKAVYEAGMDFKTVDEFKVYLLKQIHEKVSSDGKELAILGIELMRKIKSNNDFVWQVLGNEIVENIIYQGKEKVIIPMKNDFGPIEYLGRRYEMKEVEI
jgi:hypothetical protein